MTSSIKRSATFTTRSLLRRSEIDPKHIHLSNHRGYDLKRSNEFFDKFRHFTLETLRTIKDGFRDEHCCVPKLGTLDILGCCGGATIQHGLIQDNIEPRSTCQSPISNSDNQTLWDVHL